jgi:flagellum-specific ATP synthase
MAAIPKPAFVENSDLGGVREFLRRKTERVPTLNSVRCQGEVLQVVGLLIESQGPLASVGDICHIELPQGSRVRTQVVGFRAERTLSMPLDEMGGLQPGCPVILRSHANSAAVGPGLLGRILDGFGDPIDNKGPLACDAFYEIYRDPPGPLQREAIAEPLSTGVRVIDALLTCGKGQRLGILGGSGVGKSTLLGAMARGGSAAVNVIALIGERNREVRAFVEETLGTEGLKKSVVVAATSDRPAPVRVRATFLAATIADYFRDQGNDVLLIMDSVTRFAMAQREIGLAVGEPPSQKGYTPSVFQLLPRVFERAGNFATGSTTGFYTVLVEGDDMNDPIADSCRALLDGHIVLSRELASSNHYPAVDVLESVSRLARAVSKPEHVESAARLRDGLAAYRRAEDLIQLGAYASGSNPKVDAVLQSRDDILNFLRQESGSAQPMASTLQQLQQLAGKL